MGHDLGNSILLWLEGELEDHSDVVRDFRRHLEANPSRIADAYAELLEGYQLDPQHILTAVEEIAPGSHHGVVESSGISFVSLCKHHFLPFAGSVSITYRPGPCILGLGKIPRLVRCRSRRLQLQELLVKELAEDLMDYGHALAVEVTASAQHVCICYRGPDDPFVRNTTTYNLGTMLHGDDNR